MALIDGKELGDHAPAPKAASVLWKKDREPSCELLCRDLQLLADLGDQAGLGKCPFCENVLRFNS